MKSVLLVVSLFGSLAWADSQTFGEAFDSVEKPMTLAQVLLEPTKYEKQDVVVTAKVDKVCKKKGCWFEVAGEKGDSTKVVFKDYSFFVPKDIDGKQITMSGHLKNKKMSVREQRHYLKDAGASKDEIKAVKEPKQVYQFVASGVQI